MVRLVEAHARRRRNHRRWEASWDVALARGTVRTELMEVDRREGRGAGGQGNKAVEAAWTGRAEGNIH